MASPILLISVEQAFRQIMAHVKPTQLIESIDLLTAHGRTLANDIISPVAVPPADNSAMDGYALHIDDINLPIIPISQRVAAGTAPLPLQAGTCARVFTGTEIPQGANLVVMQEDVNVVDLTNAAEFTRLTGTTLPDTLSGTGTSLDTPLNNQSVITISGKQKQGAYIRAAGQDVAINSQVLSQGAVLSPRHMGVLASIGIQQVQVYRKLKIAVISTGSELVHPGDTLQTGQIYNSNRYQLAGLIDQLNCQLLDYGIVKDDAQQTKAVLQQASETADLIITSGGVSVGEEDHVKACVEQLGQLDVWKLAIKPGKPLAFGHVNQVPIFGLPGNPASVLVTFLIIAKPFIQVMQGQNRGDNALHAQQVTLQNPPRKANQSRQEYVRVKIMGTCPAGRPLVKMFTNQNSGVLSTAMEADGLAIIPIGAYWDEVKGWVNGEARATNLAAIVNFLRF